MSGTTGISLSYVIRDSVSTVPDPTAPIQKKYVLMAPHHVPVYQEGKIKIFNIDSALVKDSLVGNTNVHIFLAQSDG